MNKVVSYVFLFVMFGITMLIIAGPDLPFIANIAPYLGHLMVLFFLLGFIFLCTDQPRKMFISYALCTMVGVFLKNESNGELLFPKDNHTDKITVSHINLGALSDIKEFSQKIQTSKVDVISLQEVTPDWAAVLSESLKDAYPYIYSAVRIDPYGKAIYSKFPLKILDTLNKGIAFDIVCEIEKNEKKYTLLSTYLTPPLNESASHQSKIQINNISKFVVGHNKKLIVLGEFNMVYWANEIRRFRQETDLNNSRKDVMATSLRAPNDHTFYTKDLQCILTDDFVTQGERIGMTTSFQQNTYRPLSLPTTAATIMN
jgi:exonuclease III